ncbi:MAG: hypothetical protein ACI3XO_05360 [Eubacteriales bacterium]
MMWLYAPQKRVQTEYGIFPQIIFPRIIFNKKQNRLSQKQFPASQSLANMYGRQILSISHKTAPPLDARNVGGGAIICQQQSAAVFN